MENTYEAWRVTGSESGLKLSSDFDTPERALDDLFDNFTLEQVNENCYVLEKVLVSADEKDDNNDVIEVIEAHNIDIEEMLENKQFSEYLYSKFDNDYLDSVINENKDEVDMEY